MLQSALCCKSIFPIVAARFPPSEIKTYERLRLCLVEDGHQDM